MFALAIISATAAVITNPLLLFTRAREYHEKVVALENEISSHVGGLQVAVTDILRISSNATLNQIELNVNQIFALDDNVRSLLLAADDVLGTPCHNSLTTRLNAITEFSGYESSVCVSRHDRNLTLILTEINGLMESFKSNINGIQMLVIRSFISINIWMQSDMIVERFIDEFERIRAYWNANSSNLDIVELKLSASVANLDEILIDCFEGIQARAEIVGPSLKYLTPGSTLKLICKVLQSTEATAYIFWYHDNRMINYDLDRGINVSSEADFHYSELTILHTTKNHSGNYTCVPSNSQPASVVVHIFKGDVAAMYHEHRSAGYCCWIQNHVIGIILFLLIFSKFIQSVSLQLAVT
ncbi:hypothetical protein PVAND_007093 [Polypedilum vanderplanki]|uniref:Ig-like domain-containing protein n=1 Tax=Polypedilum vanderplanki TaxID=319348 RepID=A0A9J6C5Y4_POLVA|nr:hypothetical protein PVAND_007093 [Polypedilum vanderplanki]